MQDKLTRAIKVMHGWHKLSGILGGKIYPGKVHLFPLRHIHIGTNAIAKNMQISIIKQIVQRKCLNAICMQNIRSHAYPMDIIHIGKKVNKSKSIISKFAKIQNAEICKSMSLSTL